MTILWFLIWLILNTFYGHQPLLFDPVNGWTATLILAIGIDLAAAHAPRPTRNRNGDGAASEPRPAVDSARSGDDDPASEI